MVSNPFLRIRALQNKKVDIFALDLYFFVARGPAGQCFEVSVLAHRNAEKGLGLSTLNGRRVGTTLVAGGLLGQAVQIVCTIQIEPWRSLFELGDEQEVHFSPNVSTAR